MCRAAGEILSSPRGRRVAILSRGYQSLADGTNDEARELALLVPDAIQRQHADRVQAAETRRSREIADVLILDDGFQHRRLHRDLDVVLVDATRPDGFGHLLPRRLAPRTDGRHSVARTRSSLHALRGGNPQSERPSARGSSDGPLTPSGSKRATSPRISWMARDKHHDLASLQDQPVAAFCGIGNPVGFRLSLQQAGMQVVRFWPFPDHHHYSAADIDQLTEWSCTLPQLAAVVCTRKDMVKLNSTLAFGRVPLRALAVDFRVSSGWSELEPLLVAIADTSPPNTTCSCRCNREHCSAVI